MRKLLIATVVILTAGLIASANAAPNMPQLGGAERTVQWRQGVSHDELQRARIVRIPHGFHAADLATLRDDQTIETPSGNRVSVGKLRAIRQALAQAKARPRAPEQFHILPPPTKPCTPPRPGETYAQILTRPDADVICMHSGESVSVAQLRLMKSYIERTQGVNFSTAVPRPSPSGPAVTATSRAQLATLLRTTLKDAPDSTVLANTRGERTTLGAVRAALMAKPDLLTKPAPAGDGQR